MLPWHNGATERVREGFVQSQVNTTPDRVQNVLARKSRSHRFYWVKEGQSLRQTKVSEAVV